MASSDDESDKALEDVSDYFFEDGDKTPISFSVLPVQWNANKTPQNTEEQIYVRGTTDEGLQNVCEAVMAWRFDLSGTKLDISVLIKGNNWIKLKKPKKSYMAKFGTVLVAVNFLHLVKRYPELPEKGIFNKLSHIFRLYDHRPSLNDLVDHKALVEEAVKQDESLKKSKCLMTFLENPQKRARADEDTCTKEKEFIVDEDASDEEEDGSSEEEDGSGEEEDDEEEPFDSVCCICDEGGSILCCEGTCMRSFHATRKAAAEAESGCASLGLSEREVEEIPYFRCKNCEYKLHQCYACGQLGSSDKSTGAAEVFQCVNAICGYFYHPQCVAKLLHGDSEVSAKELEEKIVAGESFTCPLHVCVKCKQPGDTTVKELQMAVCRRCPKAYHKKCLPKEISFSENKKEGIPQRAWKGLLKDRILIYCLKHKIRSDIKTPTRDHIKFPGDEKKEKPSSKIVSPKDNVAPKKKKLLVKASPQVGTKSQLKKKIVDDSLPDKKKEVNVRPKAIDTPRKSPTDKKSVSTKVAGSSRVEEEKNVLGDQSHVLNTQQLCPVKPSMSQKLAEDELTKTSKPAVKTLVQQLDSESERRILDMMKEASSTITLDHVIGKYDKTVPSHKYKKQIERNKIKRIKQGKVEAYCEAVRAAIKKLEGGGSFDDVKAICDRDVMQVMYTWKDNLKVYLAPFLNGPRYTSFGRHFTQINKLKEIVDKIHWYVKDGDTIVDFCCGANDFSWLMKQKLDQTGKKCSFKNYDIFPSQNDFCFEQRNWMTVETSELPPGNQLIMGLNPPFGVRASKANEFINKALQFKPKLLVLIVPPETERLENKRPPYDLVWEDNEKLSGRSFYLPGTFDANQKQMEDWNIKTPALYLWSRRDWTARHKVIAQKHGQLHGERENRQICDSAFENRDQTNNKALMNVEDVAAPPQSNPPDQPKERSAVRSEDRKNQSPLNNHDVEAQANDTLDHNHRAAANRCPPSRKRRNSNEKHDKGAHENFPEHKRRQFSPTNAPLRSHGGPRQWSPNPRHGGGPHRSPEAILEDYNHRQQLSLSPSSPRVGGPHVGSSSYDWNARQYSSYSPGSIREEVRLEGFSSRRQASPSDVYPRYRRDLYEWPTDPGSQPDFGPRASAEWARPGYTRELGREPEGYGYFNRDRPFGGEIEPSYRTSSFSAEAPYSRMSGMSAMERYNPRLDELNHVRMGDFGPPERARPLGGGVYYDHQASRLGYGAGDRMGFAPGPLNSYPHPSSSSGSLGGWITDPPP